MLPLTVLSPHRDDAVFSLALALSRWSKLTVPITILNFFTVSAYAPHASSSAVDEISSLRQSEDREAITSIDPAIEVQSLDLLDAPLRLNISPASISAPENLERQPRGETEALALRIHPFLLRGLVLAPLALGDHIDHQAVRYAALSLPKTERLAFYEDLPYATWTAEEQLTAHVQAIEHATGVKLEGVVVNSGAAIQDKRHMVSYYASQITNAEADSIAEYASRYGGAERIWIPKDSTCWRLLLH